MMEERKVKDLEHFKFYFPTSGHIPELVTSFQNHIIMKPQIKGENLLA